MTSNKKYNFFMRLAKEVAKAGTCLRLQVGSVLVNDGIMISVGYNGAPAGLQHCMEVGCDIVHEDGVAHCARALHADQNALLAATILGHKTKGAALYTTHAPCYMCAKMLIQAGIAKVVYLNEYDNEKATKVFKEASVERIRFQSEV